MLKTIGLTDFSAGEPVAGRRRRPREKSGIKFPLAKLSVVPFELSSLNLQPLSYHTRPSSTVRDMLTPLSAQAGPSRLPFILSRPFSSTPIAQASKRKALAKRRKAANLARRHQLESASNAGTVDPVLGIVVPSRSSSSGRSTSTTSSTASTSAASVASEKYLSSRLARTVLSAPAVWNTPPTTGPSPPERLLPGISAEDRAMIFGAVPAVSAELASMAPGAKLEEVVRDQEVKSGVLARVLDLRNASKRGIEVANRQRIVEAFGADAKGGGCGGSKVQGE